MQCAIDISPAFLPWALSAAETHYGAARDEIEQALATLSCRLWATAGVPVPAPSQRGKVWLAAGYVIQTIGIACALSLLPLAIALLVFAGLERPEQAIVALWETNVLAVGSLLVLPGMAMIHHANLMLLRLPPDLGTATLSARNPFAGRLMQRVGLGLAISAAGVAGLAGGMLALGDPGRPIQLPFLPSAPALLVLATAGVVAATLLIAGGVVLYRFGRATLQASADELLARDKRRPVLLLRSFGDDDLNVVESQTSSQTMGQMVSMERLEESIVSQFKPFGPLIAIGKPGEQLPALGASRNYYAQSDWQAAAQQLMDDALLIVVIAGTSAGLRWELETIARAGHQAKLLILMPEPERAARWECLVAELRDVPGFGAMPGEMPPGVLCLYAGAGRSATILTSRQSWKADYDAAIQYALYGMLGGGVAA